MSSLAPSHSVVAIDLAGHGQSTAGDRRVFTMQSFAQDVRAVVDDLGLREVILVGHSMGGAVILEAARLMPGQIRGLVGVDTFVYDPYHRQDEEQIKSSVAWLLSDYAGAIQQIYGDNFGQQADREMVARQVLEASQVDVRVGRSEFEELLRWDVNEALSELGNKVICIFQGALAQGSEMTDQIRRFNPRFVYDAGHFLMLEAPKRFNSLLIQAVGEFGDT